MSFKGVAILMKYEKRGHTNKNKDAPFFSECGNKLNSKNQEVAHQPKKKLNGTT